jgi:hypothetical protein
VKKIGSTTRVAENKALRRKWGPGREDNCTGSSFQICRPEIHQIVDKLHAISPKYESFRTGKF